MFHQAHHCILQTQALSLELLRVSCRRDVNRRAENRAQFRERPWHHEAVPTFQAPAARVFHVDRHDRRCAFLGKKDNPLASLIDGPARTVGSDQDVAARGERVDELAERDHTLARARTANRAVARAFDEERDKVAIAAGADQPVTLAGRKAGIEDPWQHEQPVMPDGEDDRLIPDKIDHAVWVLNLQTKRARPKPIQPEAEHDQDARAPALELHFGFDDAPSSRQR